MATPAFCPSPCELALDRLIVSSKRITVVSLARPPIVACPLCGSLSRHVHSRYTRTLADFLAPPAHPPWRSGAPVLL
jgi:hypothetical protein